MLTVTVPEQPTYWGDLAGEPLDAEEVRKARALEIEYSRKMNLYNKVPLSDATRGGHQVFDMRWVDFRKADGSHHS